MRKILQFQQKILILKGDKFNECLNGQADNQLTPEKLGLIAANSNVNGSEFPSATTINLYSTNTEVSNCKLNKQIRSLVTMKGIKDQNFKQFINDSSNNKNGTYSNQINKISTHFLGKEDQFKDYSILVGSFQKSYMMLYGSTFIQEAKMRGFLLEIVYDDKEFVKKVNSFDIAWIVDSAEFNKKHEQIYINAMQQFFKSKKSLYIHASSNKCYSRANLILSHFFNDMSLSAKLKPKEKFLTGINDFENNFPYTFDQSHSLAFGIPSLKILNEQSLVQSKHSDFSNFIISQNSQPLVLYAEENENHGRIILDCGFLSYDLTTWISDNFHHYLSNSTVWLTGIPN